MDDQQKRLFLALVICAGIAIAWQALFAPPMMPPPVDGSGAVAQEGTGQDVAAEAPTNGTPTAAPQVAELPPNAPQVDVPQHPLLEPQTMVSRYPVEDEVEYQTLVSLTNAGGAQVGVEIVHPDQYRPHDADIYPDAESSLLPMTLHIPDLPGWLPDANFELVEDASRRAEGGEHYDQVTYRWSNGTVEIDKVYSVAENEPYLLDVQFVIRNRGSLIARMPLVELVMATDGSQGETGGVFNPIANTRETVCLVGDEFESQAAEKIESPSPDKHTFSGAVTWAGVQDRYFLNAVILGENTTARGCRFERFDTAYVATVVTLEEAILGPGEEITYNLRNYAGPKDQDAMTLIGADLSRSVNLGIFTFLAVPMKWVLKNAYNVVGNWGLAIILLTILVKLLMFPWTQKAFKSMERMKAIQPKLTEMREKYKNDRTKMTEETMKLYKEHNVSPFGCLPMLLQMPIYIALYRTIYSSVELYNAEFVLWITDLSARDPYYILPVLMSITMVGQQLLTPQTIDNPQMKWVMRTMPIMFGIFMLVLPSGLVLYIFISSLLGIGQQWHIRRQFQAEASGPPDDSSTPGKQTRQQRRQAERRSQTA